MALQKVTFSLDVETVTRLRTAAERLHMPYSQVVREAIAEYASRVGRLSDAERVALLRTFDQLLPPVPARPASEVAAELRAIRAARRRGGRQSGRP
jgi:hypothetical protein